MQTPNNQYNYVDPLNQYTLSSGVLLNKANIEDEKVLLAYESIKVSKRLEELYLHPIQIKDSSALLEIHRYLFQDVYKWAGKVRTVNISKDGKPFFEGERFQMGFTSILCTPSGRETAGHNENSSERLPLKKVMRSI
jgi:cell filamentation protein